MESKPSKSCDPAKKCEICDRVGLPVLPLRYAISRSDVKGDYQGPGLSGNFGKGVSSVELPEVDAHYTLRLARQGYLYVFNEVRGEWKGFQITSDSYLLEFDPYEVAPPREEFEPSCARMADSEVNRFVVIPDPQRAGNVWFGFTEAPWPADVLKRNRRSAERKKHMRCINVQDWLGGKSVDHAGSAFDAVNLVSEFKFGVPRQAADQPSSIALDNEKDSEHLPAPISIDGVVYSSLEMVTVYGNPAFDFSFLPFARSKQCVPGMVKWLERSSSAGTPAMLALNDPAGLTQELSSLVKQFVKNFEEEDDRGWKQASSVAIKGIKSAIEDQASADELASRRTRVLTGKAAIELYSAGLVKMPEELTPEQDRSARDSAWKRYSDDYDGDAMSKFDVGLESQMQDYTERRLTPLAKSFVHWYKSETFRDWLVSNHHDSLSPSGMRWTEIVEKSLDGLVGHELVQAALLEDLKGSFEDIKNATMRALVLNDSAAAKILEKETKSLMNNPGAWSNIVKAYGHVLTRGRDEPSELRHGLGLLSGFVYKISGSFVTCLAKAGKSIRVGGANIAVTIAMRNSMLGVLGMLSGKRIERVGIKASEKEMAHFLVEAMSRGRPGVNRAELRARIDQHLREELNERSGARVNTGERNARGRKVFQWAVFWDSDVMAVSGARGSSSLHDLLLTEDQVRVLVRNRAAQHSSRQGNLDVRLGVVGLIIDAWNVNDAFGRLDDESDGPSTRRRMTLGAALVGFAGTSVELASFAVAGSAWGRAALASEIRFGAVQISTNAGALGFLGRAIGTFGALLSAAVDGWKAFDSWKKGDLPMTALYSVTALSGAVVGVLMLAGYLTAGVGFIVLLILGLISMLGEWIINLIRDDKVEVWIDKTPFGKNLHGSFESPGDQEDAYVAMLPSGA